MLDEDPMRNISDRATPSLICPLPPTSQVYFSLTLPSTLLLSIDVPILLASLIQTDQAIVSGLAVVYQSMQRYLYLLSNVSLHV